MKILLIENSDVFLPVIQETLSKSGHASVSIPEPTVVDEDYLALMLSTVRGAAVEMVFSIGFYPQISLACGALNIRYTSWVIDSNSAAYDYSVNNPWNRLYVADMSLYKELRKKNLNNIYYLPLASSIDANIDNEAKIEIKKDVLVWADFGDMPITINQEMEELLDSTKGYLDAMIAQRKSDLYSWSLYEECSDYVKRDVEKNYPLVEDSYESVNHKYDFNYLFPHFDYTYADMYLQDLLAPWNGFEGIDIAYDFSDKMNVGVDGLCGLDVNEIRENNYRSLLEYRTVAFFPTITNGNKLSTDIWNAMAVGATIVIPEWIDVDSMEMCCLRRFKNRRELRRAVNEFKSEPDYRDEYSGMLKRIAHEQGTISDRIKIIFNDFLKPS